MKQAIEDAKTKIDVLNREITQLKEFITAAQRICNHDFIDAPDLFNYHTREGYVRCNVCGIER